MVITFCFSHPCLPPQLPCQKGKKKAKSENFPHSRSFNQTNQIITNHSDCRQTFYPLIISSPWPELTNQPASLQDQLCDEWPTTFSGWGEARKMTGRPVASGRTRLIHNSDRKEHFVRSLLEGIAFTVPSTDIRCLWANSRASTAALLALTLADPGCDSWNQKHIFG